MSYELIRTVVELQSLALTLPVLFLCLMVVFECVPALQRIQRRTQMRWILLGICIGFFGNMVDNFYWMIPWTANYLDLSITPVLVNFGVFPNLIFRQIFTITAAYCHLRAFISPDNPRMLRSCNIFCILTIIAGQIYIYALQQVNQNPINE